MSKLMDNINNKLNKARVARKFCQFSSKLMQMRMTEAWAKFVVPSMLYKRPPLPIDMVIRVTEKCFLKCKFCGQGGESGRVDKSNLPPQVEISTIRKIADEASRWPKKPFIKITGGEPLTMGGEFVDTLQEMREKGLLVKLNTNGMLLKNKKLARRVAETDVNYLSISIDGGGDVHNSLRGNPKLFDSIMEGIDNVKEYCRELGKSNLMILFSTVVSSDNEDQVEEVYRIARSKNIDWFNIQFLNYTTPETSEAAHQYASSKFGIEETPWAGFCNPRFNQIDPANVERQINNILAERSPMPVSVMGGMATKEEIAKYYFTTEPIRKNICVLPFTGMHIHIPGKAVFCIDYPFYEYGDVREDTLENIWYGERATNFRKDMIEFYRKNGLNYPQCQRCNWRFN